MGVAANHAPYLMRDRIAPRARAVIMCAHALLRRAHQRHTRTTNFSLVKSLDHFVVGS